MLDGKGSQMRVGYQFRSAAEPDQKASEYFLMAIARYRHPRAPVRSASHPVTAQRFRAKQPGGPRHKPAG